MQENNRYLPMVQNYIRDNMPSGAYVIISKRLESQGLNLTGPFIQYEIRVLKKKPNLQVITECLLFLKENNIALDSYCEDFIRKEDKK